MKHVPDLPKLVRNAGRLNEVLAILAKYGLAEGLAGVQADWLQRHLRSEDGQTLSDLPQEERVRLALTDLGPTFVKLGQILSTRADVVGPSLAEELSQLQKHVPPDDLATVRQRVEEELGAAPEVLFAHFDAEALASASIGQVHRATLRDGTRVVVKIQHDGIRERVRNDLEILRELAKLAERHSEELARFRPVALVREFERSLSAELDFRREKRNLEQFTQNFADDDKARFPAPHERLCSARVLTMDFLDGICVSDSERLEEAGYDREELARRGADLFLQMVFRDGFYHADPHPGNLMVLDEAVIGLVDCGMVGRVDEEMADRVQDFLMAAIDKDARRLAEVVEELGEAPPDIDRDQLRADLLDYVAEYGSAQIEDFDLTGALNEMMRIVRTHHIILPARVSLLIKMLVMLEGTAQHLSPNFSITELLEHYRQRAVLRRLSPRRVLRRLHRTQRDWTRLFESFPRDATDLMARIRKGTFNVHLDHRHLDAVVNRLVVGLLTAALFLGSSTLLDGQVPPLIGDYSLPGVAGMVIAVALGFRLLRAIRHSGDLE
ncbi:MAG: AarF/ABC1/UbiB kinase family protein [Xanthomonadales bacterium]|nr:AarF/ABC1/UbiB kinase family protein [Xanthomonadales bacterium]